MPLLDSNVVIYAIEPARQPLRDWLRANQPLHIASVTRIEVLGFNRITQENIAAFAGFFATVETFPLTDEIVAEAREVRRAYDGFKMKLEVLTNESKDSEEGKAKIAEVKRRLADLKLKFSDLKKQRLLIATEIEAGDDKVDLVDEQLNEKKKDRRMHASEAFQVISEGNKEISILRAESGLLDTQMRQLYVEIGRFISRNTLRHPACAVAASSHQGLVDVMRALRRSIALNHRLAGNA